MALVEVHRWLAQWTLALSLRPTTRRSRVHRRFLSCSLSLSLSSSNSSTHRYSIRFFTTESSFVLSGLSNGNSVTGWFSPCHHPTRAKGHRYSFVSRLVPWRYQDEFSGYLDSCADRTNLEPSRRFCLPTDTAKRAGWGCRQGAVVGRVARAEPRVRMRWGSRYNRHYLRHDYD